LIEQLVISMAMHLLKGLTPTGARDGNRTNDQLPMLNFQIDITV